ncbi:ribonuclease HI [Pseudobacteriovorax antillogorgiicola]|uniref:Ribonuclease H n=1 Tax=Pseudobacteriovorax antillogorgiicola TaxID=1513793 RepID=A0A1Y6CKX4_9BACT|nr:ribonuclease HI [Pseudobacteriovorax antillogorgiicola]TCS47585.1 ribonuclease HI [Pseudobacteriovorax antillogorgiicola]SMF60291.1 ribonuclease HI [Pseudobacteriovorax antillogorgiicola]
MNKLILDETILIFTDGACKGNPGPGGWGAVIAKPDGHVFELGRGHKNVTNNQMEMTAIVEALHALGQDPGDVAILTDSTYVIQGITQWIWGWMRNGWKTASGNDVSNKELWQSLLTAVQGREKIGKISWHYVRGHRGIEGNERVDHIASELALGHKVDLYDGTLLRYDHDIHNIPEDTSLPERKEKPSGAKKKAYSYLSYVNGELKIHKTWAECEARVRGRSGAKFKKAMSASDEQQIKEDWGLS